MKKAIAILLAFTSISAFAAIPAAAKDSASSELTITPIPCGSQNAYIISQGDSAILVDTATRLYRRKIERACEGYNIKLIVITHAHHDHAQNAAYLRDKLGAPIAMHPADLPFLANLLAEPIAPTNLTGRLLVWVINLRQNPAFQWIDRLLFTNELFDIDVELKDGMSLKPYGVDGKIIGLPGHTPGSIGIVTAQGLIAGDALMNLLGPDKAAHGTDLAALDASAAKITALGDIMTYPGHGSPMENRTWVPDAKAQRIERVQCGVNNVWILAQGDSAILVDTATKTGRRKIERACRDYDIKLIVLTHGHYDHAQNAAWLSEKLGAPVGMHPADLPVLADLLAEPIESPEWTGKIMLWFFGLLKQPGLQWIGRLLFANEPFEFVPLKEGMSLKPYGVDGTIIELPGHTRGSIGIVADSALIAGDALTNLFGPGKAALYSDIAAMDASADKAAALGDLTVYPGHGAPMENGSW